MKLCAFGCLWLLGCLALPALLSKSCREVQEAPHAAAAAHPALAGHAAAAGAGQAWVPTPALGTPGLRGRDAAGGGAARLLARLPVLLPQGKAWRGGGGGGGPSCPLML